MWRMRINAIAVAALVLASAPAAAECQLKRAGSLDLVDAEGGGVLVPVGISGTSRYFYLNITRYQSSISRKFVDENGFKRQGLPPTQMAIDSNGRTTSAAVVPQLQLGDVSGSDVPILMDSGFPSGDPRAIGVLSLDLLMNFDVELDLNHHKLDLFSQDHCPGQVVYWAKAFVSAPIVYDPYMGLSVKMALDGKPVSAVLTLDGTQSAISMNLAHRLFGIGAGTAGMEPVDLGSDTKFYRYPFKALAIEGLEIKNPSILVYGSEDSPACDDGMKNYDGRQMICYGHGIALNASQFAKLHLYFAFKEMMLYLTAADEPAASPSPQPATH